MKILKTIFLFLFVFTSLHSCNSDEPLGSTSATETSSNEGSTDTTPSDVFESGDIIISSYSAKKIILFDSDGNFKQDIAVFNPLRDSVHGLAWDTANDRLLAVINGTPDRVLAYDKETATETELINNSGLNGNTYGLTVLDNNDILVIESNSLERFSETGQRIGNPFANNIQTTLQYVDALSTGGFVACSTGTDRVRIYDDDGVQLYEATSSVAGTTNAYGCMETSDGNILVAWNGTTDTIILYNSDLSTELYTFSDTSILPDPRTALAETSDGYFLIPDYTYEYIVVLDSELNFVEINQNPTMADPWGIVVVP
ncbi:MAG: hypothetical protein H6621_01175 [Halobacteriovoraceae bacterium]|nr:hypothetical protein [Halobacteriovoraceae bacterium]MCB9093654.1 hypothetical protein [Halobacteriovoraceae bacterium]